MKPAPVTLTIRARDTAHARAILEAVEQLEEGAPATKVSDEILVTPHGEPPLGHSYRELRKARLGGLLEATLTRKGLLFTRAALEAYRARKGGPAPVRVAEKDKPVRTVVEDLTAHRIRALERAGITPRRAR